MYRSQVTGRSHKWVWQYSKLTTCMGLNVIEHSHMSNAQHPIGKERGSQSMDYVVPITSACTVHVPYHTIVLHCIHTVYVMVNV